MEPAGNSFRFEITQSLERGTMEIAGREYDFVTCGAATLSGLDIPVITNIGIMGILFSINRDIMEELYSVSICMTCNNRQNSTDPYQFNFHVDYRPIESSGEEPSVYEERCIASFKTMADLFEAQIKYFVTDPEGLEAMCEYLANTDDPLEIQLRHVKDVRDAIMVKAGFRTKSQIADKVKARKAHERLVQRPKNLPRTLKQIVNGNQSPRNEEF